MPTRCFSRLEGASFLAGEGEAVVVETAGVVVEIGGTIVVGVVAGAVTVVELAWEDATHSLHLGKNRL